MITQNDVRATFNPSAEGHRSLGYGSIILFDELFINYTVIKSNYGLGFFVILPSRQVIKNGVPEKDENGRNKYSNEVFVKNGDIKHYIDNAVQNAMINKGVHIDPPQPTQNNSYSNTQTSNTSNSSDFSSYINTAPVQSNNVVTPVQTQTSVPQDGTGIVSVDELPF